MEDIFNSSVRSTGDLAGVFEFDGETSYFYLYSVNEGEGGKVLDAIHVFTGNPDFSEVDISVRWDSKEENVGLFIKDVLWAVFGCVNRLKLGGGYKPGGTPSLPAESKELFISLDSDSDQD